MKEKPILFSGPMVRAILEWRKSQTRRLVNWPLLSESNGSTRRRLIEADAPLLQAILEGPFQHPHTRFCPYGQPGDRLWVRETWKTCEIYNPYAPSQLDSASAVQWLADGGKRLNGTEQWGKTRVSIHMPKWASRIMLEVVSVRVERLQDISEGDALAEGMTVDADSVFAAAITKGTQTAAQLEYWHLWEKINGKGSWAVNPWVWVVEFKRVP